MTNSLAPAFVQINYHSDVALHTMRIPTNNWSPVASTNNHGQFDTWNAGDIDAEDMVEALVTLMLPLMPTSVTFDNWVIFTQADEDSDPLPQTGESFSAMVGSAAASWYKAVQITISARTVNFNIAKLVLLDAASGGAFAPAFSLPGGSPLEALFNEWSDLDNGWSGRDNTRPNQFISSTATLNEKLRRSEHLV